MALRSVGRLWRTVRHLRPVQIYGRLGHWLPTRVPARGPALPRRALPGAWLPSARREPSLVGPDRARFLSEERPVGDPQAWNDASCAKLWLYNLHYFDDLQAADADERAAWHRSLIARWVAENPPPHGNGWEPYPVSLRLVNWSKWLLAGHAPVPGMLESIAQQATWLTRRLEHHLLGNHLFANAKALVFVGVLLDGSAAERWRDRGQSLLRRELPEQVLADGGHFERSTMYHALALEDVLDLLNLEQASGRSLLPGLRTTAQRMAVWLQRMCHGDGEFGFFNDAALGIAPATAELLAYAQRLGVAVALAPPPASTLLQPSGYARLQLGDVCVLADVAPVGPDYLPGHAHADTLSFEASHGNQRVLVNTGTSRYGLGPQRLHERGTAAHNTVTLDNHDSSEVWSGFRVGRRARPVALARGEDAGRPWLQCGHDGYAWLPGRPLHLRRWALGAEGLQVDDEIRWQGRRPDPMPAAVARFHLHPSVQVGDCL